MNVRVLQELKKFKAEDYQMNKEIYKKIKVFFKFQDIYEMNRNNDMIEIYH